MEFIQELKVEKGKVTAFNRNTCWGKILLESGRKIKFHSTSFQSHLPTRFPILDELVKVILSKGELIGVRSA